MEEKRYINDNKIMLMGIVYVFIIGLDLADILTNYTMINQGENVLGISLQSWVVLKYIRNILFFTTFAIWNRKLNIKPDRLIALSLILLILSELFFISYFSTYNVLSILGHAFRIIFPCSLYIILVRRGIKESYISLLKEKNIYSERKNLLNSILESSQNGILLIDDSGRIIHFNNNFAKMLNGYQKFIPGKRYTEIIPAIEDLLYNPEEIEKIMEQPIEESTDNTFYLRSKNRKIIELTVTPFIDKELLSGRLFSLRDITERYEVGEMQRKTEIRQSLLEKAQEVEELKSSFIRTISHELSTPLNIILGAVQLISINKNETTHAQLLDNNLEAIRKNCLRLVKLTDNLIDINQIDSGFMYLKLENYNLVSIVEDIVLSVVKHADCKDIKLVFDTDIEECIIACDIEALERIILNLLSNSIKFTKIGGNIKVDIKDRGESVIISVKDNGVGIPPDMLETIFDRFKQVDLSLRRKQEGSGIGLSIVKSLVEMHGGEIFLYSEVDRGTEFIIELPIKTVEYQNPKDKFYTDRRSDIDRVQIEFSDIYELN